MEDVEEARARVGKAGSEGGWGGGDRWQMAPLTPLVGSGAD